MNKFSETTQEQCNYNDCDKNILGEYEIGADCFNYYESDNTNKNKSVLGIYLYDIVKLASIM